MDVQFLRAAVRLARRAVYSFHKTSTRDYLVRTLQDEWNLDVKVVAEMKFDIPNMYKFHKQKSVDVEVDLIRVGLPSDSKDDEDDDDGAVEEASKDDPTEQINSELGDLGLG